jgi:DNA gyrase subunit B
MTSLLTEMVIHSAALIIRDSDFNEKKRISGDELGRVAKHLTRLGELIGISERRGTPFAKLLDTRRDDPKKENTLPKFRVVWPGNEIVCWSEEDARKVISENDLLLDDMNVEVENGNSSRIAALRELHENRELDALIDTLSTFDIDIIDYFLVQEETVSGEKLSTKFAWIIDPESDKQEVVPVPNIPDILDTLRQIGRRGIEIKRFKGLGEMNPEELWNTTLNPETRTLLKVEYSKQTKVKSKDDQKLIQTLMGNDVAPRKDFIISRALDVSNLDI